MTQLEYSYFIQRLRPSHFKRETGWVESFAHYSRVESRCAHKGQLSCWFVLNAHYWITTWGKFSRHSHYSLTLLDRFHLKVFSIVACIWTNCVESWDQKSKADHFKRYLKPVAHTWTKNYQIVLKRWIALNKPQSYSEAHYIFLLRATKPKD